MISKESTFEDKVSFLKEKIRDASTSDEFSIRNIFCLVSAQDLSDDFFASDKILFKDLVEFSDIKTELRDDIVDLKKYLSFYYLSVITSCRAIYFIKKSDIRTIPSLYKTLMGNLGIFSLNAILSKNIESVDVKKLENIDDAIQVMAYITTPLNALSCAVNQVLNTEVEAK